MTPDQITAAFGFRTFREVQTKYGPKQVATVKATDERVRFYREHQAELREISYREWQGEWQFSWWRTISPEELAARKARVEQSRATDADIEVPCPEGLAYLGYQKAGIAFCLQSFQPQPTTPSAVNEERRLPSIGVLIGDEMGLSARQSKPSA